MNFIMYPLLPVGVPEYFFLSIHKYFGDRPLITCTSLKYSLIKYQRQEGSVGQRLREVCARNYWTIPMVFHRYLSMETGNRSISYKRQTSGFRGNASG